MGAFLNETLTRALRAGGLAWDFYTNPLRTASIVAKTPHVGRPGLGKGLSRETAEILVPRLDEQMASLFTLFHQDQKHHWVVTGPHFRDPRLYLEESYGQVHEDLDAVAERITVLGGVPSSSMSALLNASYVEEEPEGVYSVRDMITRDRETEKTIASKLRPLIGKCREGGD